MIFMNAILACVALRCRQPARPIDGLESPYFIRRSFGKPGALDVLTLGRAVEWGDAGARCEESFEPGRSVSQAMSTTIRAVTADELLRLHGDGMKRELIRGEIKMMSPAGYQHGSVSNKLARQLGNFVVENSLGDVANSDTGFLIASNPDTVRAPDVSFVRRERFASVGVPTAYFPGAPDLAVEVVSPNDTAKEVEEKTQVWLAHGTDEVWVVRPRERTVTIYRSDAPPRILSDQEMLTSPALLPGFSCSVRGLFAAPV
jgi:Uma2 family endonuclease